jgi:C-terminal processing protease CtpA/Prc
LLVTDVLSNGGILPYAEPRSFASLESKTTLFHPLRYAYTESSERLPLYVAVDGDTWSAAEYFAAVLQDNGAATIVGEVTGGAGCGYTNGGIPTTLKNSHAAVKMPDCVRLRKDGSNEVSGITPDVLVPWSKHDSAYLRAEKLFQSLLTAVAPQQNEGRHEAHQ